MSDLHLRTLPGTSVPLDGAAHGTSDGAADGTLDGAPHGTLDGDLEALPPGASGAEVWSALGAGGHLAACYRDGDPRRGVRPAALARLLAATDARFGIPATLSVSVPLATTLPVLAAGTTAEARRALEDALAGRVTTALAATDVTAGTDLAGLRTAVHLDGDTVEVTGEKQWIANATTASWFLVLARLRPGRHFTAFTWVLVPSDAPGVHVRPADSSLYAASGTGHVRFDGVRLTAGHLVDRVGMGLPSFARHIATERLAGALWGVALCRRVLADTRRRLAARAHGEATLWDNEAIRQRFAACLVRTQELHALCEQFAEPVARRYDTTAAATLKAAAGATVGQVLGDCAQWWGAAGFADGSVQQTRAQAALFGIGGGATEVVLATLADSAEQVLARLEPRGDTP